MTLLFAQTHALAWNDVPHMIIGQIATSRLNPVAKQKVDAMPRHLQFPEMVYAPVTMAAYMDDVRADPYYDSLRTWHYVILPFYDGVPPADWDEAGIKSESPKISVVTQIPYAVNRLRELAAATAPLSEAETVEEAQLLAFLMHMVGDIHQPLHCATRYSATLPNGDAGGNGYRLQGQYRNLHAFWDAAAGLFQGDFGRPFDKEGVKEKGIRDHAFELLGAIPPQDIKWQGAADAATWAQASDKLANEWAQESYTLALNDVYHTPEGETPGEPYTQQARKVIRLQMAKAGYRLAALINSIYPQHPPPPQQQQQQQQQPSSPPRRAKKRGRAGV